MEAYFEATNAKTARMLLNQVLDKYGDKTPKVMKVLEKGFEVK
jgi:transposase-like protein